MQYHKSDRVVVLTKDFHTRKTFREVSTKFPDCSFKIVGNINELQNLKNIKILFIGKKYSQTDRACMQNINNIRKFSKHLMNIPIVLIMEDCSFQRLKSFFNIGIDSVLYKPLKPNILQTVLLKHLNTLKDSLNQKVYHDIILYPELKILYYKECKIFLSDVETTIMEILLPSGSSDIISHHSLENLRIEINRKLNYEVSDTYIRVSLSRLRTKFVKYSGLNLIKNKYARGYYISI